MEKSVSEGTKPGASYDSIMAFLSLRDVTARTGVVHTAQSSQIILWAAVVAKPGTAYKTIIDTEAKRVSFDFDAVAKLPRGTFPALDRSVKWLLGNEWVTKMIVDGETIFRGRKISQNVKDYVEVFDQDGKVVKVDKYAEKESVPWRDRLKLSQ